MPEQREYHVRLARFPGNQQEHPKSSNYYIGLQETLLMDPRIGSVSFWDLSDTPITMTRNRCVREALEQGVDYLLMIDSDMSPDAEPGGKPFWDQAWNFLMERREAEESSGLDDREKFLRFPPATVAAPYCGPPPVECVYVFRWAGFATNEPNLDFKLMMVDRDDAADRQGIEEVAALPTGLILYDLRLFHYLGKPWFDYEWTDEYQTHKKSTEDVFQTRNASLAGFPQFCAWDSWAAHIKIKEVRKPVHIKIQAMRKHFRDGLLRTAEMVPETVDS